MKPLTCIAIDDEPLALELIESYCNSMPELRMVSTFEDAVAGAEFLNINQTDLLFVDINMPDINGLELVRSLKERPMVVFTTAYKDFAFEGYELEAIDYLLKPIEFTRFERSVKRAIEYYSSRHSSDAENHFYVYSEYRLIKIHTSEILYIESLNDYIRFHFDTGKPVLTLMSMKKVLDKLPPNHFIRVHRSYIVAANKVNGIWNKKIQLQPGIEIPIGESFAHNIKRSL
jgi:two-component system, LytTR family, response regulator